MNKSATKETEKTVQVGLRVPTWVRDEMQRVADAEFRSLNSEFVHACKLHLNRIAVAEYDVKIAAQKERK